MCEADVNLNWLPQLSSFHVSSLSFSLQQCGGKASRNFSLDGRGKEGKKKVLCVIDSRDFHEQQRTRHNVWLWKGCRDSSSQLERMFSCEESLSVGESGFVGDEMEKSCWKTHYFCTMHPSSHYTAIRHLNSSPATYFIIGTTLSLLSQRVHSVITKRIHLECWKWVESGSSESATAQLFELSHQTRHHHRCSCWYSTH